MDSKLIYNKRTAHKSSKTPSIESDFQSNARFVNPKVAPTPHSSVAGLGILLPENCASSCDGTTGSSAAVLSSPEAACSLNGQILFGSDTSYSSNSNLGPESVSSDSVLSSFPLGDPSELFDSMGACSYLPWPSPDLVATYPPSASVEDFLVSCGLLTKPDYGDPEDNVLVSIPRSASPTMPPLVADINMFEALCAKRDSDVGVNPNDILPNAPAPLENEEDPFGLLFPLLQYPPLLPIPSGSEQAREEMSYNHPLNGEATKVHPFSLSEDIVKPEGLLAVPPLDPCIHYPVPTFNYQAIAPLSSSCPSAFDNLTAPQALPKGTTWQKNFSRRSSGSHAAPHADQDPLLDVFIQTPVLNAHLGIHIDDLMRRAAKYRSRNPGQALCQQWLLAYAGQLSQEGEQLGEWRCYVIGCSQRNKRRDHILTHVGSHVDERPYHCEHCPMRFLRSNEHRRHLAAHSGEKPWVCNMCTSEDRAFARQDLLKRHLKRAHGIGSGKENRPCKRVRRV